MKAVHFRLKPEEAKSGPERKSTVGARLAAERNERPRDWPFGVWPEPSLLDPGTEKRREPSTRRRCYRTAHKQCLERRCKNVDVWSKFAEDASKFSLPYLYLVDTILKSKNQPQIEKIRGQNITEMVRLNNEIRQAQIQQKPLIEEIRQLYTEMSCVQDENKFFLDHITSKTEEYKKQPNKLWASFLQKVHEIEKKKQMSSVKYETEIARLKTELLEKEKMQHNLKKYLEGMRSISMLKEKQEDKLRVLKKEKEKVPVEKNAKIQEILVPFLQEKALLDEQLKEPDIKRFGKSKLFGKNQDVESVARHQCVKFSQGITKDSLQVQKELLQLIQHCVELEAAQKQLKTQKHQLQQKEWYLEGLVRGRKRLQRRHRWCSEQEIPKATMSPPHGTKSKINLK